MSTSSTSLPIPSSQLKLFALLKVVYQSGIRAGQELSSGDAYVDMANLGDFELNSLVDEIAQAVLGVEVPVPAGVAFHAGRPSQEDLAQAAQQLAEVLAAQK